MVSTTDRIANSESGQEILDAGAKFEADNADLFEALRIFGMSNAQYENAVRALSAAPIVTTASTAAP